MYTTRGNLPSTRENVLLYELAGHAINNLSKAICQCSQVEMLSGNSTDALAKELSKALEPITDLLEPVTTLIGAETQVEKAMLALVGMKSEWGNNDFE